MTFLLLLNWQLKLLFSFTTLHSWSMYVNLLVFGFSQHPHDGLSWQCWAWLYVCSWIYSSM